ncbi:paramyosin [Daphnia magna]|uniref:Endosome-associated-trafficking regulator 1 n=2 Tax=Daphnia magna TaxID=35525 RepID=A0A0N8DX01_9CRUS|nr:paramyosin [Daphnia magna]KAK4020545.1 hypothetical protein OUZ56_002510 [Daphnia magna]KZS15651.1 Serologically defined colon cancer antigen 3 protein [Daphnia magna]
MDADGTKEESESSDNRDPNNEQSEGAIGGFLQPSASASTGAREDNPFSFRHFLRRSQNTGPCPQPDQHRMSEEEFEATRCGGARPKTKTRTSRHGVESDVKSPCGLPDFVQDYLGVEHDLNSASYLNGYHVPDQGFGNNSISSDSPLDLPRSHSPIHAAGAMPIPLDIANFASPHIEDDVEQLGTLDLANLNSSIILNDVQPHEEPALPDAAQAHEINNNENVNSLTQLPDFLSDGPMQSGRMNQESIEASSGNQVTPHNSTILEENARLRQQLEMAITNERMALARIDRLETLLEEHRRRESEEASSLERSMEQIESNLKIATQRATQSESQVVQLKKENRRLQDEVKSLQEAIRLQYNEETSSSQSRSLSHTAQELQTAANSAERSIRDLLAGVDHLRVVAAALQSMERIEEVRTKRERDK